MALFKDLEVLPYLLHKLSMYICYLSQGNSLIILQKQMYKTTDITCIEEFFSYA